MVNYSSVFRLDYIIMSMLYHGTLAGKTKYSRNEIYKYIENIRRDLELKAATGHNNGTVLKENNNNISDVDNANFVTEREALYFIHSCGCFKVHSYEFLQRDVETALKGTFEEEYNLFTVFNIDHPAAKRQQGVYRGVMKEDDDYYISTKYADMIDRCKTNNIVGKIIKVYTSYDDSDPKATFLDSILKNMGIKPIELKDLDESNVSLRARTVKAINDCAMCYGKSIINKKENAIKRAEQKQDIIQIDFDNYLKDVYQSQLRGEVDPVDQNWHYDYIVKTEGEPNADTDLVSTNCISYLAERTDNSVYDSVGDKAVVGLGNSDETVQ